jgi:thiol-disulfide isomerase/thioredoxin
MNLLLILSAFLAGDEWRFQLEKPSGYYVVFFTAKWCGPCQRFKANGLQQLQAAYPVTVVDIDAEPSWRSQVDRFPTFWLCRKSDRQPIAKWTGAITPDIVRKAIPAEPEPPKPMSASGTEQGHILPLAVVALEGPSSRWSGVVISPNTILTCAHHGETSGILATVQDGRKIGCAVLRSDTRVDLSLLRLSESLPVASGAMLGRDSDPAYLVGYLGGTEPQMIPVRKRPDVARISGVRVLPLDTIGQRPDSISGMSGGPVLDAAGRVVGILRCADKTTADAVRLETIREFLE